MRHDKIESHSEQPGLDLCRSSSSNPRPIFGGFALLNWQSSDVGIRRRAVLAVYDPIFPPEPCGDHLGPFRSFITDSILRRSAPSPPPFPSLPRPVPSRPARPWSVPSRPVPSRPVLSFPRRGLESRVTASDVNKRDLARAVPPPRAPTLRFPERMPQLVREVRVCGGEGADCAPGVCGVWWLVLAHSW